MSSKKKLARHSTRLLGSKNPGPRELYFQGAEEGDRRKSLKHKKGKSCKKNRKYRGLTTLNPVDR